ncbi:hydroxymethylglutaryl-CoA lyase [Peribacillus cavernae]|uniref:Hydroxymethylglutaryl-CoA lyase n=1 Tax=Peribacillus cavernae TaxID=1674310 RepID=A0A3S0VHL6_9BACI|nr:hydroxymethylglutaryl-CoA lyase [Peribacillus cavernae]MDQ0217668.1 hydroxymethylglutaryl-CoA lyase [Peribacillus cavernae]RUQ28143.1 hydroxymethylglutaryl-CoA lyase [Peribacillus cavernae]
MIWECNDFINVKEVGPRDGLQMEKEWIPTAEKIKLINALSKTGVNGIQVTSVVHPKAVPQLADAEEVMRSIERHPGVSYSVLVPNERGAERAVPMKADEWELMHSVTESHSLANANKKVDESLKEHEKVVKLANEQNVTVQGGMATALGCPFEGKVPFSRVAYVAEAYYSMGIRSISIADTIGVADPKLIYTTMNRLINQFPDVEFSLHLHNTRGMAIANVLAGIDAGVRSFDASMGGLGGCPYAPGATGNVSTEDLVHMLDLMNIPNGVDLNRLLDISKIVETLVGHTLESAIYRAGPADQLQVAPTAQKKIGK